MGKLEGPMDLGYTTNPIQLRMVH